MLPLQMTGDNDEKFDGNNEDLNEEDRNEEDLNEEDRNDEDHEEEDEDRNGLLRCPKGGKK